jgi:hypothetical protein
MPGSRLRKTAKGTPAGRSRSSESGSPMPVGRRLRRVVVRSFPHPSPRQRLPQRRLVMGRSFVLPSDQARFRASGESRSPPPWHMLMGCRDICGPDRAGKNRSDDRTGRLPSRRRAGSPDHLPLRQILRRATLPKNRAGPFGSRFGRTIRRLRITHDLEPEPFFASLPPRPATGADVRRSGRA